MTGAIGAAWQLLFDSSSLLSSWSVRHRNKETNHVEKRYPEVRRHAGWVYRHAARPSVAIRNPGFSIRRL
jgi:hypothetical protein